MSDFHSVEFSNSFTPNQINTIQRAIEKGQRLDHVDGQFVARKAKWFQFGPVSSAALKALKALPPMSLTDYSVRELSENQSQRKITVLPADRFTKLQKIFGKGFWSSGIQGQYTATQADEKQIKEYQLREFLSQRLPEELKKVAIQLQPNNGKMTLTESLAGEKQFDRDVIGQNMSIRGEVIRDREFNASKIATHLTTKGITDKDEQAKLCRLMTQGLVEEECLPLIETESRKFLITTNTENKEISPRLRSGVNCIVDCTVIGDEVVIKHTQNLQMVVASDNSSEKTAVLKQATWTVEIRVKIEDLDKEPLPFTRTSRRTAYEDPPKFNTLRV